MVVDVAVFCGIIALMVPIDDQTREKWPDQRTTLSDCSSFFTIFPYFQWVLEAALARVPASVVMYNFNVWTRGASKKNFIKCSLKLKFS